MKKRIFLPISILFIVCITATAQNVGALTVFSEDGDKFYLILNGQRQNNLPQTNVRVEGLSLPNYTARIIFEDSNLPEINRNYLGIADGNQVLMDATYKIKHDKKGMPKLGLMPTTFVPYKAANVAANNTLPVSTTPQTINTATPGAADRTERDRLERERIEGERLQHERNERERREHEGEEHRGCGGRVSMSSMDFASALNTIKNESFDDTKLSTAKQIASGNCLSVGQIADICRTFSFEDRKLTFAKFAYDHCTEPGNYFKLNNIFTFNSSVDDLNKYLADKQATAATPKSTLESTTVMGNGDQLNNERIERERREHEGEVHQGCTGRRGMTPDDFVSALNTVKGQSFDDTKLSTAKEIASANCLSVGQIADICRAFSFEDRKLTFAKFAFDHCTEPGNYFKLNNVFTFNSNVDDLNKYVQSKQ